MTRCLVTGASGYVGSRLVGPLVDAGREVVATGRDTGKLDAFDWPAVVDRVQLDVSDEGSLSRAFEQAGQVDVAYFLVHSIGEGDFSERDLDSARHFARAAKAAGVRRLIYLGGFVPDDDHLSEHLESRSDVGRELAADGPELVWLRAAVILGAGSTSFELVRHIADRVPVIPIPTWMNRPVAPIAIDDVLHYLVAASDTGAVPAGAYEISNGEEPTYAQLLKAYARTAHRRRVWLPFPPVPPKLVAFIGSRLTPLPRELTEDLIMSLPNTMSSHDDRIRRIVPDPPGGLTTVESAMRRAAAGAAAGVAESDDPLRLAPTDPRWAGPR